MKLPILHPFLFAIFPVLSLYAKNISELLPIVMFWPIIILMAIAGFFYLVVVYLLRVNKQKAALFLSLIILSIFSYGHFYGSIFYLLMKYTQIDIYFLQTSKIIFTVYLFFVLCGMLLVIKGKKIIVSLTLLANVISVFLILFSVIQIVLFDLERLQARNMRIDSEAIFDGEFVKTDHRSSELPDIYYFIFDRYAGFDALKKYFNYDNSSFKNFLVDKDFYVIDQAQTNYPKTFLSLASSLNMEYLDYFAKQLGPNFKDQTITYEKIQHFKALQFLKLYGYRYINVSSGWLPTRINTNADLNIIYRSRRLDEFSQMLLKTTILYPFTQRFFASRSPQGAGKRERMLFKLEELVKIAETPGPKFVFSHFLLPHPPYVFGPNGEAVTADDLDRRSEKENYLRQLEFTTKQIMKLVENILAKSKSPPVIILQSDEGPFIDEEFNGGTGDNIDWTKLSNKALQTHMEILNAYFLPGVKKDELPSLITPVNTFRLIFNSYFGTSFPLLDDKSYIIRDLDHPYSFIDVTDRLRPKD